MLLAMECAGEIRWTGARSRPPRQRPLPGWWRGAARFRTLAGSAVFACGSAAPLPRSSASPWTHGRTMPVPARSTFGIG